MSKVTSTRSQIVEGAFAALLSDGLPNLSYDRIAQAAGTSRQLVRYHFRDPDALMISVCERLAVAYRDALADAFDDMPEGADRLERLLDFYFDLIAGHEKPRDDQVFDALVTRSASSPRIRHTLRSHYASLGQLVADEAMATHPELSDVQAAELSYVFVALMYGHWRMISSLGFSEAHGAVARDAMARVLASYRAEEPGAERVAIWSEEEGTPQN